VTDHAQVWIEHERQRAEVDIEIASLLLDLWPLGLWTLNSCQDNVGKVWIDSPKAAEQKHLRRSPLASSTWKLSLSTTGSSIGGAR
jgi:hypothetical protein